MKTIKRYSVTEYFAKKRVIQESIKTFRENKDLVKLRVISTHEKGKLITIVKVDRLIELLGYDFRTEWERVIKDPILGNATKVLDFFNKL